MTQQQPSDLNLSSVIYLPFRYISLVILLPLIAISCAFSAAADERPKVGVVLGGGGAKGAAHIGVLKALEEMHIPVDYIVGTSMGAYVGGLYATGMSAEEIEALMTSVDWASGYEDRVKRSERRVREKQQEDRFQVNSEIGFEFWKLKVPRGFVQGQRMGEILRSTSGNLPMMRCFDDLAIPYRAVATDIERLEPVVLKEGDLAEAMQASMSVPGLLPPLELDGRLLVDGGITNNLPISVVQEMGADIIIAVDISNEFKKRDELEDYVAVMDQLTDFMVRDNAARQLSLLKDKDIVIRPDIRGITTTDFDKMPEAFAKGYRATKALQIKLQRLGDPVWFQTYIDRKQRKRRSLNYLDQLRVDQIKLVNLSHYSDQVLLNRLKLEPGKVIRSEALAEGVSNLYALDRFERVDYRILREQGENVVQIEVKEKSWGPNFIDLRFALEDDFQNTTDYSIGAAFNVTGLSGAGAEWRTELEYGTKKRIATELYLPFVKDQAWFSLLRAEYKYAEKNITGFGEEPSLEEIGSFVQATYTDTVLDASFGWQPELWQEFRLGARYIYGETEFPEIFGVGTDIRESRIAYLNYNLDTLDNFIMPRHGNLFEVELAASDDINEFLDQELTDVSFHLDVKWKGAASFGPHTLMGKAELGRVKSDEDLRLDPKELGGFLNLSGIPKNSLAGNNKIFSALVYRYDLLEQDFGLFNSTIYLGSSVEWGGVYNDDDISLHEAPLYVAGSVFSGLTTPLGPLILAYGQTEQNNHAVYLFFGGAL
ncbi:patatin-like phospholipase family protein [Photobacterium atrarenae]|uniref:Patatin-like phospholipase family protein n=1 Tax=Photobacterium atrarenae TaxID=865757 RepID=A0ABY5GFZ1_9GAMM|nr:patatin-like phospholipase family protein [Photobacterium atrarenae]UTV28101.1 patatin-like phospholipase family protein [Photobacterium atrarenae]